jgi:ABC-type antimicrobial peptide transport system permease subunit
MVVGRAVWLAGFGAVLGTLGALAGNALVRGMLDDADHASPRMFLIACLVVCVTASLAALLPARRAATINPIEALRNE